MRRIAALGLAAVAAAILAAPASGASISETLKKFNGKTDQTTKKADDGEVLATKGDWTLSYDHAWSSSKKAKVAICSMSTGTKVAGDTKQSWVFYTRWAHKADTAEFAINWGPNVSDGPASLVLGDGHKEALYISQGVGFLNDAVDKEVADAFSDGGSATLSFEVKESGQAKRHEQEFSLSGFGEIYKLLFSDCDPVEDFQRKQ